MARANFATSEASSDRPLYLQLVDSLRIDIANKTPGDRIDSEPQLSRRFGVSRFTVTRAIEILVDEGLISRRQGLGTFVAAPALKRAPSYLSSFSEAVSSARRVASHRVLAYGPTPWRESLPYREDEPLISLDRLRFVDRVPTAIHRSIISAAIAERIGLTSDVVASPSFSLYRRFDETGLFVDRGVETLRARGASLEESRLLRLDDSRVVMAVCRCTFAADGTILDVVDAVYDARRYAYEAEIRRAPGLIPSNRHPQTSRENDNVSHANGEQSFGPRLGPWGDVDSAGG
ncbi:GntR family transcriptional regulator [Methylocapsa sp. S129]|uniref:GntR family transcriptional regulator n=1 Tax=Methylocapsa sp. S129 TaxID=1641869 RepID=UPI00131D50DD|nr:GntR family transcriptional regulator [Methylocapsa sp. S129]